MSDNEFELPQLRTAGEAPPVTPAAQPLGGQYRVNELAELVVDLLAATELIPPDRLALVRGRAQQTGSLTQALVEEGVASSSGITRMQAFEAARQAAISAQAASQPVAPAWQAGELGSPDVDLDVIVVDQEAAGLIPLHVLEQTKAIPYALEGDTLRVAVADLTNVQAIDVLRLATRYRIDPGRAELEQIEREIQKLVRRSQTLGARAIVEEEEQAQLEAQAEEETDLEADDGVSEAPLVRLVNSILFQAAEDGASDVHFAPQEDSLVVRFRIDGVLQEMQRIPKRMMAGVTTRLKVLAKLDIAERRKPQDGRIALNAAAAGRNLDVRVATLPTVYGEQVVMRLLDREKKPPTLEQLGLSDAMRAQLATIVAKPTGALLVTGPTGSGKSTTLFACLNLINSPDINIITVEDPVEYRLGGVNQVQINNRAGLTFAAALRSILRSDPDVVMVGEIRDGETAKISIEAALTGHLVLSTLHTNDAPSALTRLNEMGVEPFLTGAAVSGVLAQRLARKLCSHCCEMYSPSAAEMIAARVSPEVAAASDGMAFYRKRGCPRCNQTGYKGRIGIYQLLEMTEDLASLAARHATREEIERAAMDTGMKTLWDDGLAKVAAGLTSIEELARVTV